MSTNAGWTLDPIRKILNPLNEKIGPALESIVEQTDALEGQDMYFLQVANAHAPDPFGLALIYQRGPYSNPDSIKTAFGEAVERGWLQRVGEGAYTNTEKSQRLFAEILEALGLGLADFSPLPIVKLEKLHSLLDLVVETAIKKTHLDHIPALKMTRKFAVQDAALLQKIRRRLIELLAFRDDCHVCAWAPHKIEGYVWEAFSFIWEEKASSAAEVLALRPNRGFSEEAYAGALENLAERGWVERKEGKYSLTEGGRTVREQAEALTDEYYAEPWASLTVEETEELRALFSKMIESLEEAKAPA